MTAKAWPRFTDAPNRVASGSPAAAVGPRDSPKALEPADFVSCLAAIGGGIAKSRGAGLVGCLALAGRAPLAFALLTYFVVHAGPARITSLAFVGGLGHADVATKVAAANAAAGVEVGAIRVLIASFGGAATGSAGVGSTVSILLANRAATTAGAGWTAAVDVCFLIVADLVRAGGGQTASK